MEDFLFSLRGLKSLSPAASTLQCHTRRGKLAEWLHGATHEYHVNVGSEPALGFTALTPTPSYFLHVRVSLFMCVWFFFFFLPPSCLRLMQNGRGIPNHPLFHAAFTFHPPSPAQFFCPSGFSEQPSDFLRLWSRRSDTLYIMACAMLKGLITLPLISLQQHQGHLIQWTCSVYHQYLSANAVIKGEDRMWMTFGSLRLSAGVLYVTSRLLRHHLWKPGEQLCRGRRVFKRRIFFLYQDKRKTAAKTLISDKKGSQNMHDFKVWSSCTDTFCITLAYSAILLVCYVSFEQIFFFFKMKHYLGI